MKSESETTMSVGMLTTKEVFAIRSGNKSQVLNEALFNFLHAICKAVGKITSVNGRGDVQFYTYIETSSIHNQNVTYELPEDVAIAFRKLRYDLEDGLSDLFKKGEESGKNLLFQMNSGGLSLNDFDNKLKKDHD